MGACDVSFEMPATATKQQVIDYHREIRDISKSEDGCSYSGCWGMIHGLEFRDRTFTDYDEAYEFCLDNADKWGDALVVKVNEIGKPEIWLACGLAAS